jgi:WD40 repeat protein
MRERVFISYSRRDAPDFAHDLATRLSAENLSLYRDLTHLEGGVDWWRQVEEAIRTVEHVVLVLTPAALASPYVAREWRLARQEGKQVSPIQGPGALDFTKLPSWMARAHRYDIILPEQYARLVAELKTKPDIRRVPFMADELASDFVARPAEFDKLKGRLLDARGDPVAITAALRGAGGFGKTALANALCHDSDIQDAFADGILRVTLGEKPGDLLGRVDELIKVLTGERRGFQTIDAAKMALAEALDDRQCLLVIDDAWAPADLAPFLHRGPRDQTTRLITTRDDAVLPKEAARIRVDAMTPDQSRTMLARGLPAAALPAAHDHLTKLADGLGEWPLLLDLANGVLRGRIEDGESFAQALDYAERSLQKRGISRAFLPNDAEERRRTASGTLDMSLERVGSQQRERFAELAVFVEDAQIPIDAALGLWQQTAALDEIDGDELLSRLAKLSLLLEFDRTRRVLRLHDVVRTLLREGLSKGRLVELDHHLVAHWRTKCDGRLACVSDDYALRHLIAHLKGADETDTVADLLANPEWIASKVRHLGIQSLLADYVGYPKQTAPFAVGAALTLAANALSRRPQELPAQLLGRLSPEDAPGLEATLKMARSHLASPTLVPLRPSFTPPGAELRRYEGHGGTISSAIVLADGRRALWESKGATLRLWDLETGTELRHFEVQSQVSSVTVLPDGRRALLGCWDHALRLYDLEKGAELGRLKGHKRTVSSATVLADGQQALSGSFDQTLRLWDLATGTELRRFEGHENAVSSVAVLFDGRRALSGSWDHSLRLWDLDTGAELRRFEGHGSAVTSVKVLADKRRALSGSYDWTLRLWDLETGTELRRFKGHEGRVNSLAVLAGERRALSGSEDRTMRLWDLDTGTELRRFEGHERGVTSVTALADGGSALSVSDDGTLRLWDLEAAKPRRFIGHESAITSLAVLADGRCALSGSRDWTLRLWDLETGTELRRFKEHEGAVRAVTVLADGRRALSGSNDGTVRLWDLETGAELRRFRGHGAEVVCVTALADGQRALLGSWDGTLRLWDLEMGTELRRFDGYGWINTVTILANSRHALSGSWHRRRRLWLWDLETGAELRRLVGHEMPVTSVAVSADGRRALSGSHDKTLRLWDLETGIELHCFRGHEDMVTSVTVLGNGRHGLSASLDKTLRLWDLEAGTELACLTCDSALSTLARFESMQFAVIGDALGLIHIIEIADRKRPRHHRVPQGR